jgi:hypothetical protein
MDSLLLCWLPVKVEVKVILRLMVSWPVLLWGHHLGPATNFSFTYVDNIFRHLQFSSCGAPSLMRGQVCNLFVLLLLGLASAVTLGSKSFRTYDHIFLSHLRLSSLFVVSYDSLCADCANWSCMDHLENTTSVGWNTPFLVAVQLLS